MPNVVAPGQAAIHDTLIAVRALAAAVRSTGIIALGLKRYAPVPFILLLLVLIGCHSSTPPTHYYAAGDGWAIYLAWTEDTTGHLQGQVQVIGKDPDDPAKLKSTNGAFTGTRNGSDISIAFPLVSNYLGATWTGTLKGDAISLVIPTNGLPANPTLQAGSFEDFQKAAQRVQAQVNVAQQEKAAEQAAVAQQQAAAQAAAEQQLRFNQEKAATYSAAVEAENHARDAFAEVRNALAQLDRELPASPSPGGLRSQYATEWSKMQGTWAEEQAAAQVTPMTCYRKSQIAYIGSQIAYENSEIKYLDAGSKNVLYAIQSSLNAANEGLDAVSQWAPEYYQRAQAYSQLTGEPSNVTDPTSMLATFRKQTEESLNTDSNRVDTFEALVKNYDERADALQQRAQAFPESIACSG